MLRYILWRLLFEISNVKRLFGHGCDQVHYLGFGANLSGDILAQRRIRPFAVKHFTLHDHALRFDHPSPWIGCGYASAEPAPGEKVHGLLFTLSVRDAERMDFYEAVPVINRYRRTWVEQDGVRLYFYQTNRSTPNLSPTREYLGYIVEGLRHHPEVSEEYFDAMAATRTAEPGRYVSSYLWNQPHDRARWLRALVDAYQRVAVVFFIHLIYRYSPTAPLIRFRERKQ